MTNLYQREKGERQKEDTENTRKTVQQASQKSGSILPSKVSPAQQQVIPVVVTKMNSIFQSPRTVTAMVEISHGPRYTPAGSSGRAGTKRGAPLMCPRVFTDVWMENLRMLDPPRGAGAPELSTLGTGNMLLCQQWEFLPRLRSTAKARSGE